MVILITIVCFLSKVYNGYITMRYFLSKIAKVIAIPKPNKYQSNPINYRSITRHDKQTYLTD